MSIWLETNSSGDKFVWNIINLYTNLCGNMFTQIDRTRHVRGNVDFPRHEVSHACQRCTPEMRAAMVAATEAAGDFWKAGLSFALLDMPDFWAGHCFTSSSHPLWRQLFVTTGRSALDVLQTHLAKASSSRSTCKVYEASARRKALALNLADGILTRRKVPDTAKRDALALVDRGAYDEDFDKLIAFHNDAIGDSLPAFDAYLAETCSFVTDVLLSALQPAQCGNDGSSTGASQSSVDNAKFGEDLGHESAAEFGEDLGHDAAAAKFREDLGHDVETLLKIRTDSKSATENLQQMEQAFEDELAKPMRAAHAGVVENFVPMLPFRADDQAIIKNLQHDIECRVARVAELAKCETCDVLRVAFFDLPVRLVFFELAYLFDICFSFHARPACIDRRCSNVGHCITVSVDSCRDQFRSATGSPTAPTLDFCGSACSTITGAGGLSIIIRSDTPSGKGRTKKKIVTESAGEPAPVEAGDSADRPAGSEELPAAPSDFHEYRDMAQLRSLLVKDFARLLKLGDSWDGRFPQPVNFRFKGQPNVQAVCVQPAAKMVWQAMKLIADWELSDIEPTDQYVELGAGSAGAARKGEIHFKKLRALSNKNCRFQRGTNFFLHLFKDLAAASNKLAAEDGRRHPILFVDGSCWGGDSMEALRA